MTKKLLFVVLGVIILIGLWLGGTYNGLVSAQERARTRFADLEVQYQRRMDLIPNLVETVKGSARFEQATLQSVVEARSAWSKARSEGDVSGQVAAAQQFDSALSRLLVTVEAYPDIKSTQAFRDLMTGLEGTENRVAVARRDYNQDVQAYNLKTKRFPSRLVASWFDFAPLAFFQATSDADQAPKIQF